jgi:hypothetical protein
MITKQSKLLFLFFSRENPLLEKIFAQIPTQLKISDATGINQSTLSNWRRGGEIDSNTVKRSFNTLLSYITTEVSEEKRSELLNAVRRFMDVYASVSAQHSDLRVYDIATDVLGMSIEQCQKIIDEVIYDKLTIFPSICYEGAEASQTFADFGGNYHLWVCRKIPDEIIWLRCPLRVRYILSLKNSRNSNVIRCKLNAPKIYSDELRIVKYWEYDGFLRTRGDKVFWMFERREMLGSDFFYCITDSGRSLRDGGKERKILVGTYLSTDQDAARTIVADRMILERLSIADIETELLKSGGPAVPDRESDDAQKIRAWMSREPKCMRPGDAQYAYIADLSERIITTARE